MAISNSYSIETNICEYASNCTRFRAIVNSLNTNGSWGDLYNLCFSEIRKDQVCYKAFEDGDTTFQIEGLEKRVV